jgi:hypothetical protein
MRSPKRAFDRLLWRSGSFGERVLVGAVGLAAALFASCSSSSTSSNGPAFVSFVPEDCRGALVELARFPETYAVSGGSQQLNNLAKGGDTLFVAYAFGAGLPPDLPASGGIVAVPASGGPLRLIGQAENTSEWAVDSFWVTGDQLWLQAGTDISSILRPPLPRALWGRRRWAATRGRTTNNSGTAPNRTTSPLIRSTA